MAKKFRVSYVIDVEADDILDAALQVEEILNNPTSRPYLEIKSDNKTFEIDLADYVCCPDCGENVLIADVKTFMEESEINAHVLIEVQHCPECNGIICTI